MTTREISDLFADLELRLIASLKRNLARHERQENAEGGKNDVPEQWEAWQSAKLRSLQRFRLENRKLVGQYDSTIDGETRQLIQQQAAEGGAEGFFGVNDRKVKALLGEMKNSQQLATKAALRYMDDVYRKTVRGAVLGMATSSMTTKQAVDLAVKEFLRQGINCIEYSNGRRVNIASYAEMALRTASTRAMLLGEGAQREELGIDTVLVSEYGGCSNTCLPWQGLVYIDDVWQPYDGPQTLGGTYGVSRNGRQYPLLSVAVRAGLFHPNCRHTITTWIEGVSTRPKPMDKAKIEAANQLEAKQRELERRVRRAKREAEGLQDPAEVKAAKARVRATQRALKGFVDEHSDALRRDPWRERYDGVQTFSEELQQQNFENKPVTMQSILVVKPFASGLLSPENQVRLANAHKKLLMTVFKAPLGTEYGECYTLDMERLTPTPRAGAILGRIRLPDFEQPYIAIHSHPNGLTFSVGDLERVIQRTNLKILTAVGNNGSIYALEKTIGFDEVKATQLLQSLRKKYADYKNNETSHLALSNEFFEKVRSDNIGLHYFEG